MRVLVFHNRYQHAGGEDAVVEAEVRMLRERGAEVLLHEEENPSPDGLGLRARVQVARSSAWSSASYAKARALCREFHPEIAHVHNFWMQLSPSVHAACHDCGVATVQTLHNYRLLCTNALLLRHGQVCEDCVGRVPWRGVARRCYRQSLMASAAAASMIVINRGRDTWNRHVDAFITPSEHARSKLLAGNLPAGRLFVKPNVVDHPAGSFLPPSSSRQVICVGRLSEEKGVDTLLAAWAAARLHREPGLLLIVGDGPAAADLRRQAESLGLRSPQVVFAGRVDRHQVRAWIGESRLLAAPSRCLETFGNTVVEAFSCGRGAVVSSIGALEETVEDGRTGLKCRPGDARGLGAALATLLGDGALADRIGHNARAEYLSRYTPDWNYSVLMKIYRFAIETHGGALPLQPLEPELCHE